MTTDAADKRLLHAIADGLPLSPRPYADVAAELELGEEDVLHRLRRMLDSGIINRFGVIVRHRELGYRANAMAVWDIADAAVDGIAGKIRDFLDKLGVNATSGFLYDASLSAGLQRGAFDLWIALGGDGTMLRSGHLCGPCQIPILGINMGNLGFLMEVQNTGWEHHLEQILQGHFWLEARMMLKAEHLRGDDRLGGWDVINEAMVGRGPIIRPVRLTTFVDERFLTTYVADGLIAATPTGSTAYALAAGGPVLPPDLRNILLVPVAPHLSFNRAIVLAEGSSVNILIETDHMAALSVDGQEPIPLENGDRVNVRANKHSVTFVRLEDPGYFYRNLTSKLNHNITALPGSEQV